MSKTEVRSNKKFTDPGATQNRAGEGERTKTLERRDTSKCPEIVSETLMKPEVSKHRHRTPTQVWTVQLP